MLLSIRTTWRTGKKSCAASRIRAVAKTEKERAKVRALAGPVETWDTVLQSVLRIPVAGRKEVGPMAVREMERVAGRKEDGPMVGKEMVTTAGRREDGPMVATTKEEKGGPKRVGRPKVVERIPMASGVGP